MHNGASKTTARSETAALMWKRLRLRVRTGGLAGISSATKKVYALLAGLYFDFIQLLYSVCRSVAIFIFHLKRV